jgi:formylglycine-generating enzyme required for sulfatase activity
MSPGSKLLVALAAGALVVSTAGPATAKFKRERPKPASTVEVTQAAPATPPRQFFAVQGMQPLTPEIEQSLRPKDSFKECDLCPEMVVVPKGSYVMGTPANEPERDVGEGPQHRVTIAKAFAVGRFAITGDEWEACVADHACDPRFARKPGPGEGRLPAPGLSFDAAKAYLAWISKKAGRTYRLPSESEREYFTRAGTTTPFWFGKVISPQNASYRASMSYNNGPRGVDGKGPVPVDSYPANPFGLYQVSGNTTEWTEDCYNKRYTEDTPSDGSPWLEGDCTQRIVRGGEWDSWPASLRSGYRDKTVAIGSSGLRAVRTLNVP